MAAPFQPPAIAPTPAPTAAPPPAPTAVRVPGVAHAARTATRGTEVRNFRMGPPSRWFDGLPARLLQPPDVPLAFPPRTGERLPGKPPPRAALRLSKSGWRCALVSALRGGIGQVRRPEPHAEAARQTEHEPEAHRRGAVGAEQPGRRIGEPLGAPERIERDVVEVVDTRRDRHVNVLQLALLVDGELDHRAPVLP